MGGGTGDFLPLDRASLRLPARIQRGNRVARVGIDHNFVVKVLSDGLTIRDIGGPVYHLNHLGSYRIARHMH